MIFKLFEGIEDPIEQDEQKYTSARTSINSAKLPAIFHLVHFEPNTVNLDYGGGRFDNATEYLETIQVENNIYDPFNRTQEHNSEALRRVRQHGGADTATLSNVLNVIAEPNIRKQVLKNIHKLLKPSGTLYITVYEGSGDGIGKETSAGYQLNRKTADYMDEVEDVFSDVQRKGKLIIAKP